MHPTTNNTHNNICNYISNNISNNIGNNIRSIANFIFIVAVLIGSLILDAKVVFANEGTKSTGGIVDRSNQEKGEKLQHRQFQNNQGPNTAQKHATALSWIHNADFEYLIDNDGDGFFHRFRVTFDADTSLISDRIYAKLYLDNNQEERLYYVTEDFNIIGEALSDSYEVTTSLTDGYNSDIYNLRIAIYDAHTHELLDSIGAYDDEDLYGRYLEQVDFDSQQSTVFTIQELTVALSGDSDNDGFYSELDITIDADMSFGSEWVSLVVFIVDPFGEETLLYRTNDLRISGYQSLDKDITRVLLDTGYRSGYYHIKAELRLADTDLLLTTTDTTRSTGLGIESKDYDDHYNNHVDNHTDNHVYGAESDGHGGSLGWFGIWGLIGIIGFTRRVTTRVTKRVTRNI